MNTVLKENDIVIGKSGNYVIQSVLGRGATTVAYLTELTKVVSGEKQQRILKEYNPIYIPKQRVNGIIEVDDQYRAKYNEGLEKFKIASTTQNALREKLRLRNQISPELDWVEANGTIYLDVLPSEGITLDKVDKYSLLDKMKICLSLSKLVSKIHEEGYLCLDLKPENILIYPETTEMIQIIDFDSFRKKEDIIFGNSLSFSKAWCAPEQYLPYAYRVIGEATDIYSIGEIIYWLVFGRHSTDADHRSCSYFNFDQIEGLNRDDVKACITNIFHRTLRSQRNRMQNMSELIVLLEDLIAMLSQTEYIESVLPSVENVFLGREETLLRLDKYLEERKTVFVHGIGGIGKSSVVRNYCVQFSAKYDKVIYLHCDSDFVQTFCDDEKLQIGGVIKNNQESIREYFSRKMRTLVSLLTNKKVLFVIDNYNNSISQEVSNILSRDWYCIVVTRNVPSQLRYVSLEITPISDETCIYKLFEIILGKKLDNIEKVHIKTIAQCVQNHTLVLTLIAKQIKYSFKSILDAERIINKGDLSTLSKDKVDIIKDDREIYATISDILALLFDARNLDNKKKCLLKILSLFNSCKINAQILKSALDLDSLDDVNELYKEGWVQIEANLISLHPVIREAIELWNWEPIYLDSVTKTLEFLFVVLKLNKEPYNYPRSADNKNRRIRIACERYSFIQKYFERIYSKSYVGQVVLERWFDKRGLVNMDQKLFDHYLAFAKSLVEGCESIPVVAESNVYFDTLFLLIFAVPKHEERYIIDNANKLLGSSKANNQRSVVHLYDRVCEIYMQRDDAEGVEKVISTLNNYSKHINDRKAKAFYYEVLAGYYDYLSNGEYDASDNVTHELINNLLSCLDKSIKLMSSTREEDSKWWTARLILSKANILMRSTDCNETEIDSLLKRAKKLILESALGNSEIIVEYYLVTARFYTNVVNQYDSMQFCIAEANQIAKNIYSDHMSFIEKFIVPIANLFWDWEKYDKAASCLQIAIELCNENIKYTPYIRTKLVLLSYLITVYVDAQNYELAKASMVEFDMINSECEQYELVVELAPDIREKINNNN